MDEIAMARQTRCEPWISNNVGVASPTSAKQPAVPGLDDVRSYLILISETPSRTSTTRPIDALPYLSSPNMICLHIMGHLCLDLLYV